MLIFKAFGQNILTDALSKIFGKILRTIFLAFDSIIYALISYLYKIFTFLSQVRLFENDRMKDLSNRMYIIVGVISLFLVAYALISAIINPDNATKGKNSSFSGIIKNIIFAIIGIALVPTIFSYAYEFQKRVLCGNVIAKFFAVAPGTVSEGTDFSSEMAVTLFQSFYYVKADDESNVETSSTAYESIISDDGVMNLNEAFNSIKEDKKSLFEALGNFDDAFDNGDLGYLYLISTVAGLYCAYVLLGFVIDIAVRAVKLSYLQVIAPLPIMTLILPNQKKVFDNWLKKTTSCFLEAFVRVIAITFAAYAVRYLPEYVFGGEMQTCGEGITGVVLLLTRAAFIIGIFGFLKQAPKLIGELIPGFDSKGFKLGFKDSFAEVGGFRALGAAGGFASSAAKNAAISGSRAFQNAKQNYNQKPGFGRLLSGTLATVAGGAAGAVTGGLKGGYKGFSGAKDAKKWSDSKSAANKAAEEVIEDRLKKDEWDDIHNDGGWLWSIKGHGKEAMNSISDWLTSNEAAYKLVKKQHEMANGVVSQRKAIKDFAKEQRSKAENKSKFKDANDRSLAELEFETAKFETAYNAAMKDYADTRNLIPDDDRYSPEGIAKKRKLADDEVAIARRILQQAQTGAEYYKAKQGLDNALAKKAVADAMQEDFSKTTEGVRKRQEAAEKNLKITKEALDEARSVQSAAEKYVDEQITNGVKSYVEELSEGAKKEYENLSIKFISAVKDAKSLVGDNEEVSQYLKNENKDKVTVESVAKLFENLDTDLVGKINQYSDSTRKKSEKK